MNYFDENLKQSHAASDLPFWEVCYRKAFPTFAAMVDHRQDGPHQRQGIDRSVILHNGKQIWIDEKVRVRNKKTGKVYDDIAVEEWSMLEYHEPGWAVKPLFCDYIAYAIAPLGKCYLLPTLQLQQAWLKHAEDWKKICFKIISDNPNYHTISWGVPVKTLFQAIGDCLRATFTPIELSETK